MNARQHRRALALIDKLFDRIPNCAGRGSLEGRTMALLAEIVEEYETQRWPITEEDRRVARARTARGSNGSVRTRVSGSPAVRKVPRGRRAG